MVKKSKRRAKQSRRLSRRRRPKRITRARQKKRGIYKSRRTSRKNCKDTDLSGGGDDDERIIKNLVSVILYAIAKSSPEWNSVIAHAVPVDHASNIPDITPIIKANLDEANRNTEMSSVNLSLELQIKNRIDSMEKRGFVRKINPDILTDIKNKIKNKSAESPPGQNINFSKEENEALTLMANIYRSGVNNSLDINDEFRSVVIKKADAAGTPEWWTAGPNFTMPPPPNASIRPNIPPMIPSTLEQAGTDIIKPLLEICIDKFIVYGEISSNFFGNGNTAIQAEDIVNLMSKLESGFGRQISPDIYFKEAGNNMYPTNRYIIPAPPDVQQCPIANGLFYNDHNQNLEPFTINNPFAALRYRRKFLLGRVLVPISVIPTNKKWKAVWNNIKLIDNNIQPGAESTISYSPIYRKKNLQTVPWPIITDNNSAIDNTKTGIMRTIRKAVASTTGSHNFFSGKGELIAGGSTINDRLTKEVTDRLTKEVTVWKNIINLPTYDKDTALIVEDKGSNDSNQYLNAGINYIKYIHTKISSWREIETRLSVRQKWEVALVYAAARANFVKCIEIASTQQYNDSILDVRYLKLYSEWGAWFLSSLAAKGNSADDIRFEYQIAEEANNEQINVVYKAIEIGKENLSSVDI